MSYAFTMLVLEPNVDLHKTLSAGEPTKAPGLFDSEGKQRSEAIANALRLKNPKLDWHPIATATLELIQIDAGVSSDGIGVNLFPNEVGITVPFWHKGEYAREVFLQIWDYLRLIQQMTNFVIYDRQLGRIVDLEVDFESVLSAYLGTMDKINDFRLSYHFPALMGADAVSLILFQDRGFTLNDAARMLKDDSLTVEPNEDTLQVRWGDSPVLTIRFADGIHVQQTATEISKDTPYATDLAKCDACLVITFDDLEEVLDEMNTLIETQMILQVATRGFLFNTWNSQLSPPDDSNPPRAGSV